MSTSRSVRSIHRTPVSIALIACALLFAVHSTSAWAQNQACSSCNEVVPCNQQIAQIIMNEDGGNPTHFVRACGGLSTDVPAAHATLMSFPANTHIDAICVGARSASAVTQPCEVFYANLDPLTGHPEIIQGVTQFGLNPNGSHHEIVQVNWTLTGDWWIGVRFPAGACTLAEMGTRPRLTGQAAVWVSGNAWREYPAVGAPGYGPNTPIIRAITSFNAISAPRVIVNTLGPQPLRTDEFGASFDISVSLSAEPCDDIIVQVNVNDPTEAVSNPNLLTFTPLNWSTPQIATVSGVDDPQIDGDIPYFVDVVSFSSGPASPCFGSQTTTIAAINADNDVFVALTCPPPELQWNLFPPMAPPQLVNHAMAYDSNRQRVVMFGGITPNGLSNETYEWDGSTWTLAHPGGAGAPSPRAESAMAYDAARGVCVLVGGSDASGPSDETWEWNGLTWQLRASGPGNSPGGPRVGHDMAYDASRGVCVVYGGLPPLLETWEWNGTTWSPVFTAHVVGAGDRRFSAMTYDAVNQRVLLFGGIDTVGHNNDVWTYNGVDWTVLATIGVAPTPRANATMIFDTSRGVAVVQSGDDYSGLITDDTWELDATTLVWTQTTGLPPPRTFHAAAFDEARCETVLYGGDSGGGISPQETATYPINLIAGGTRTFCVVGNATGIDWSWSLSGFAGGGWSIDQQNEPGLPAGSTADAIVAQWVASMNNAACCTVEAKVSPQSSQCFELNTSDTNGFDLCVGAAGAPPTCCVNAGVSCSFNPTITEVFLSGADCDGNGRDDAIDIAIDNSLDANGDGILDSCVTYILGDMNCDLQVDGRDIQGFVLAWTSPADYGATYPTCHIQAADYNGDGIVNMIDLAAFLQALTP
ncbi:MAG: hypothetical protein H6818_17520 [Phycisphaerales bacterium]|nr:hypothetical protein [Phycisphaerales bacterium]MCB9864571.1 hypothetical protein [Phycisphaerales bacterium]